MTGIFLTPTIIWKDFNVTEEIKSEVLKEYVSEGLTFTHLRIRGRSLEDGAVGIYAVLVRDAQLDSAPALILIQEFKDSTDLTLPKYFARKGYSVLTVDIGGKSDDLPERTVLGIDKPYTVYPASVGYANYLKAEEEKTEIEGDTRKTCWYEYGRTIRYAVEYIIKQPFVTKTGVIGIGDASTALWQVLSADCGLSAGVIVGNTGWKGYRGISRFKEEGEVQFDDDTLKYLAGIEPQAYAMQVKCPIAIVSPTNSPKYDIDRAYDTFSRINDGLAKIIDYSVGGRESVDFECFNSAENFLNETLKLNGRLPKELNIKCNLVDGTVTAEVTPDTEGLKSLTVFYAEEELDPRLRVWQRITDVKSTDKESGTFTFEFSLHSDTSVFTCFACAKYENGIRICSPVVFKKTEKGESVSNSKGNVYYNSRTADACSGFYVGEENVVPPFMVNLDKDGGITTKTGALDIAGISCKSGILTFKPNQKKYKPVEGAMLMLDAYMKGGGVLTVSLVSDYFGERVVYSAQETIFADTWQNVRFESNRFKTAEGKALKSFADIQALEVFSDGELIINNFLWV